MVMIFIKTRVTATAAASAAALAASAAAAAAAAIAAVAYMYSPLIVRSTFEIPEQPEITHRNTKPLRSPAIRLQIETTHRAIAALRQRPSPDRNIT
jgi:hypothetical protein